MIFHTYDVRGVYPAEVNEEIVYKIGRVLPQVLKKRVFVAGRDARKSSPSLFKTIVRGLRESGAKVIDIGTCSTPEIYFAQRHLHVGGAVMVTASHNPPKDNGIKIMGKGASPIGMGAGLEKIARAVKKPLSPKKKFGDYQKRNMKQAYRNFMLRKDKRYTTRIIVDQSNSPAIAEVQAIKKMCHVVATINESPDGSFPGHNPNPLHPGATADTKKLVLKHKADFGVVFDGDADRIIFLDERGKMVPPDQLIGLLAHSYRKGKIIYEVRTSHAVPEYVKGLGFKPVLCAAGRSIMIKRMKKEKAVLGGEKSGHYFFKEAGYTECVALAVQKILQIMEKTHLPLSKLMSTLTNRYATAPEENFLVKDTAAILKKIPKILQAKKVEHIDGITITCSDGSWCNVRKSNTQNDLLRVNAESPSLDGLRRLQAKIRQVMKEQHV